MRCPICNGPTEWLPGSTAFLVCLHCTELLYERELVEFATRVTRRKFARENGRANDYGTDVERYRAGPRS